MNKILLTIFNEYIEIMKHTKGVLGAWHFGSVIHKMSDEYSDMDIVFLIDSSTFQNVEHLIDTTLTKVCDEITLCWEEDFNNDAIINNGYLLRSGNQLLQFDLFFINQDRLEDFMCKIHYADLTEQDIIFDTNESVKQLCCNSVSSTVWNDDISRLVKTYYYHFHMTAKYILRKDYFKLYHVMRTLYDTHASLLLTAYDKTTWGGMANKLHFIPGDKQKHLKRYSCTDDFRQNKTNLLKSAEWFEYDLKEICDSRSIPYNAKMIEAVTIYWAECLAGI